MPVMSNADWGFFARNRVRLSYALAVLLFVAVFSLQLVPYGFNSSTGIIALIIILCGVLLRSWSAGVIHKDQQLATQGPYALVRHPLYFGSWLMLLGSLLMIGGGWLALAFAIPFGLLYWPTLRNEEKILNEHFPDQWHAYTQQTGRLYPKKIVGLTKRLNIKWAFDQWRANREYEGWALAGVAVLIIQIARQLSLM